MKRRLDLASALVHEPEVLFLDEPTTGLDPASRLTVWDEVRRINANGTTVFLTTQYLEEADKLCNRVAIIDGGRIVAQGTPAELKAQMGNDVVSVTFENGDIAEAEESLSGLPGLERIVIEQHALALYVEDGARLDRGDRPALRARRDPRRLDQRRATDARRRVPAGDGPADRRQRRFRGGIRMTEVVLLGAAARSARSCATPRRRSRRCSSRCSSWP